MNKIQNSPSDKYEFPLVKINFIIMAVAVLMIVFGFVLMAGGGSESGEFNPEIFSTSRIVIGPFIAFLGFVVMGVGIMYPSRRKVTDKQNDSVESK